MSMLYNGKRYPSTKRRTPLNPRYAFLSDWRNYLPDEMAELQDAALIARCRDGRGPAFFKLISQQGKPIFNRQEVALWFGKVIHPFYSECLPNLLQDGMWLEAFSDAERAEVMAIMRNPVVVPIPDNSKPVIVHKGTRREEPKPQRKSKTDGK